MAVYHATIRYLSRSNRNTVKATAYRTGTDLYDERTGQWFYHSDKAEVGHVELLLPKDAPAWTRELQQEISQDRKASVQKLSNLAERAEKRKDSCVYREFEFALPKELTNEQNIKLAHEFLQDQVCGRGVMVLASFHWDRDEQTGEAHPHCHALFMTRRLEEKGFSEHKEAEWKSKAFLMTLREQLAAYTNFHLKLHGHDIRIDHRSYAEQGIDVESQHMKAINRRGGFHEKTGEEIRHQYEITRQRNVARLIKRPETVFDIVMRQQSTFMWGDVEKVLARYVREEDIFCSLKQKLQSSSELVLLREEERMTIEKVPVRDEEEGKPEMKDRIVMEKVPIYTTQNMIRQELSLVRLAEKLGEQQSHATQEEDVKRAMTAANEQFAQQGSRLSQDQIDALHHITKGDQLSCIIGYAGAGKSTTFKAAKEVWEASGYKVYGLAPTGRAAQNLEEIGLSSQTLHKFLKDYEQGRSRYHESSVLVLDEAGMVDVKRFNELLTAVDHLGVKLVISGDGAQSQPIEAGPGFRLVTDRLDVRKIETIVRQNVEWQKEATRLFGTYHTREALDMYLEKGHVQFVEEKVPQLETLVSQNRHGDVVELYNLSRRICGNIWHNICEDLKELKVSGEDFLTTTVQNEDGKELMKSSQEEFLKGAVTHKDFALFKEWQGVREKTAEQMKSRMGIYRGLMKEKGVDPVAFAGLFVGRDMPELNRHTSINRLIKSWGLETPDTLTPLHPCDLRKETRQEMVREWEKSLKAHSTQTHLMVTYTNRDTHHLNEEARHLMRTQGVIAVEEYFHTVKRETDDDFGRPVVHESRKAFSKGERLVFTRNDRGLNVKNGTLGTLEEIDGQKLKVRIDGEDRVVSFASKLYPYFDRGWAVTIIKSQGSTADRVFKLATFEEDRNLAYVGMTRHREFLQVFGSKLDFWREEIFGNRLSQNREKLSSLDYVSQEEAQSHLKPPARLMDALSSLGNRLESLGYYSRKGWESVCEHFLGKTRPEDRILFAQSSIEETVRAKDMGINAAPSSGKREEQLAHVLIVPASKSASVESGQVVPYSESMLGDMPADARQGNVSQREMEEETYRKAIINKQNELRKHADNPEYILSQLSQSSFPDADVKEKNVFRTTMQAKASQREMEEEAYRKEVLEKQTELRKYADNPEYILSQLSQSSFQDIEARERSAASLDSEPEKSAPLPLPGDSAAFVDEQAKVDAAKKAGETSNVRNHTREMLTDRVPSVSRNPHYSLEEVRRSLTSYSMENICLNLLGEPNQTLSNKRHLRYGNSGSLAVSLSSSSLGLWKDHSRDEGGDIFKLVQRERGGDFKEALAWVAEALRVAPEKASGRISYASSSGNEKDQAWRIQTMSRYLKACQPVAGTLGERYLREHRDIQGELSADLRFIPSAWNHSAQKSSPALATLARDREGTIKGLQVIFLDKETARKADCPINKKSFGILRGAYFHVQKGDGAVFVAEGIETALSIKEAGVRGDIYASLGISNFRNAPLLLEDKTRPLIICADQDGEGSIPYKTVEKAAEFLKEEGFSVSIIRPDAAQGRGDFNDVLKQEGIQGVSNYFEEYLEPAKILSEREQRIFSYLEKVIGEDPYTRKEAKEGYLEQAHNNPEKMLSFWQSLTGDRSFMPDGDPFSPEEREMMERYRQNMADEREKVRQERSKQGQAEPIESLSPSVDKTTKSDAAPSLSPTEIQTQEILQKIKAILPEDDFKKFEASLPPSPEAELQKCREWIISHEKSLKLDADVQKFIRLSDRVAEVSALVSGESKTLYPVMDEMIAAWEKDERFAAKIQASGNQRAYRRIEEYHTEQKRLQTRSYGNALEL